MGQDSSKKNAQEGEQQEQAILMKNKSKKQEAQEMEKKTNEVEMQCEEINNSLEDDQSDTNILNQFSKTLAMEGSKFSQMKDLVATVCSIYSVTK